MFMHVNAKYMTHDVDLMNNLCTKNEQKFFFSFVGMKAVMFILLRVGGKIFDKYLRCRRNRTDSLRSVSRSILAILSKNICTSSETAIYNKIFS